MPSSARLAAKEEYGRKVMEILGTYDRAMLVGADNVGSKQFQDIRAALRPKSVVLMGKNSMLRRSFRQYAEETGDTKWNPLLEQIPNAATGEVDVGTSKYKHLVGNVGLIFTTASLSEVVDVMSKHTVQAPARVGAIWQENEPCQVPAGNTGLGPESTTFFQVLNIATKITKGCVEIINDVNVLKVGDRVGSSEAALLSKLKIMPFKYGLEALQICENGALFSPKVLDITDDDIAAGFQAGLRQIAAFSLGSSIPTLAAVPHLVVNGFKNCVAIALGTDFSFPAADKIKDILANPGAFAAAAPAAAGGGAAAKAPEPEPEEEEDRKSVV